MITQYIIIGIFFLLSTIFFANSVAALTTREDKTGYFPDWLLFISGIGSFFTIMCFLIFFIILKDTQEKIKNPTQYELVEEPLYKIK